MSDRQRIRKVGLFAVLGGSLAFLVACAGGVSQAEYDAAKQQAAALEQKVAVLQQQVSVLQPQISSKLSKEETQTFLNEVNNNLKLWSMQPGTAPRMMELTHYFNNMWFAAQAGNWTYANFEIYRSDETVKAIKTVRPARAAGMDAWMSQGVEPLRAAVKAQNLPAFTTAYDNAIQQCNACHASSEGGGISLKGVKVTRPTVPVFANLDYKGN